MKYSILNIRNTVGQFTAGTCDRNKVALFAVSEIACSFGTRMCRMRCLWINNLKQFVATSAKQMAFHNQICGLVCRNQHEALTYGTSRHHILRHNEENNQQSFARQKYLKHVVWMGIPAAIGLQNMCVRCDGPGRTHDCSLHKWKEENPDANTST